jgi:subtilase family serine protease
LIRKIRRVHVPAFALVAVAAVAVASTTATSAAKTSAGTIFRPAGLTSMALGPMSSVAPFAADSPPECPAPRPFPCYRPIHMQQAYDFPTGRGAPTGAGQTIVVVDPYATEYSSVFGTSIDDDLAAFDGAFGIPAPPGGGVTIEPGPPSTCTNVGVDCSGDPSVWVLETALDVEWAHALAPGARIVVLSPSSDSSADFAAAEQAVLPRYPGAIVSQSFGGPESSDDPAQTTLHAVYADVARRGGTVLAGAGDFGATEGSQYYGDPQFVVNYPASDPFVLAVGGTQGHPFPDGLWVAPADSGGNANVLAQGSRYGRDNGRGHDRGDHGNQASYYGAEEVWNEPALGDPNIGPAATGGGSSTVWNTPFWQFGLPSASGGRAVPDVSYNSAVEGGILVVSGGGLWLQGGTSTAVPQWAAILALANQQRGQRGAPGVGLAALPIYLLARNPHTYRSDFHDITFGNNAQGTGNASFDPTIGYAAGPGYDLATGWGTPDVAKLIGDLSNGPRGDFLGDRGQHRGGYHGRGRLPHRRFAPGS